MRWEPWMGIPADCEPVCPEDSTEYLQNLNGHNAEVLRERMDDATMPSDAQIEAEVQEEQAWQVEYCWASDHPGGWDCPTCAAIEQLRQGLASGTISEDDCVF